MENPDRLRSRVGKYELGRALGEGTFAKVKYGRNSVTGQSVAIKIIDKEKIFKHRLVEQIKREISTMKIIKHPNIVKLYEVMASKTKIYFVLEYVGGGALFNKIVRKGRMKEKRARKYFQQLINAVDYCHSRGIYHRDLKPENLLLDGNGNLKITDFGLSALPQQLREDGLLHTTCGTPNYVAPEVIVQKGYNGAKADIWSCGVILFILMAGYLPFDDSNLMNLYRKIHKADVKFPSWFSSEACRLIERILNPNPMLRVTISEILQDPWFMKDYTPPKLEEESDINLDDVNAVFNDSKDHLVSEQDEMKPAHLNAFELISFSNGLNLSGLFSTKKGLKQDLHFTSRHPPTEIMSKMEEAAKPLGFNVQRQNCKIKLQGEKIGRKGYLSVAAEVFELAPSLFMVEMRKAGGDTLEYHSFYRDFSKGLKDIVWTNEVDSIAV